MNIFDEEFKKEFLEFHSQEEWDRIVGLANTSTEMANQGVTFSSVQESANQFLTEQYNAYTQAVQSQMPQSPVEVTVPSAPKVDLSDEIYKNNPELAAAAQLVENTNYMETLASSNYSDYISNIVENTTNYSTTAQDSSSYSYGSTNSSYESSSSYTEPSYTAPTPVETTSSQENLSNLATYESSVPSSSDTSYSTNTGSNNGYSNITNNSSNANINDSIGDFNKNTYDYASDIAKVAVGGAAMTATAGSELGNNNSMLGIDPIAGLVPNQGHTQNDNDDGSDNVQLKNAGIDNSNINDGLRNSAYNIVEQKAWNHQENDMYQAGLKFEKAASILSLAAGNYQGAAIENAYNRLDLGKDETKAFMNEIGLGNKSQNQLNEYMSCAQFNSTYVHSLSSADKGSMLSGNMADKMSVTVKLNDGTTRTLTQLDFKNGDIGKLDIKGIVDHNGVVKGANASRVNEMFNTDIAKLNKAAIAESEKGLTIYNQVGSNKIEAMSKIYDASLNNLKSDANIKNFVTADKSNIKLVNSQLRDAKVSLTKELERLKKNSPNSSRIKEIEASIKKIDTHSANLGGITDFKNGLTGFQKRGLMTVTNYMLGDSDVGQGLKIIYSGASAVKAVTKNSAKVAIKTGNRAKEITRNTVDSVATKHLGRDNKISEIIDKNKAKEAEKLAKKNMSKLDKRIANKQEKFTALTDKKTLVDKKATDLVDAEKKFSEKFGGNARETYEKLRQERKTAGKRRATKDEKSAEKLAKKKDKLEARKKKLDKKTARLDKSIKRNQAVKGKINSARKVFDNQVTKFVAGTVKQVFVKLSEWMSGFKEIIIGIIGGLGIIELALLLLIYVLLFVDTMFSWYEFDPLGDWNKWIKDLADRNYNQYIVDKTSSEMGESFYKVCLNDANAYFLEEDLLDSDHGYAWYKDTGGGTEVGHVWMREQEDNMTAINGNGYLTGQKDKLASSKFMGKYFTQSGTGTKSFQSVVSATSGTSYKVPEDRKDLGSVNANVMPILGMAMERMPGDINFDNYHYVLAYMYYMYSASHDIAKFDKNSGLEEMYAYEETDDCSYSELWDNGGYIHYNGYLGQPVDPEANDGATALCSNIYIHGYGKAYGKKVNECKAGSLAWANAISGFMSEATHTMFANKGNLLVGMELCYKDENGQLTFSGNKSNKALNADGNWNSSNYYHYAKWNGSEWVDSEEYTTKSAFVGVTTSGGSRVCCDNIHYYQWHDSDRLAIDASQNGGYSEYYTMNVDGVDYTPYICGKIRHVHTAACYSLAEDLSYPTSDVYVAPVLDCHHSCSSSSEGCWYENGDPGSPCSHKCSYFQHCYYYDYSTNPNGDYVDTCSHSHSSSCGYRASTSGKWHCNHSHSEARGCYKEGHSHSQLTDYRVYQEEFKCGVGGSPLGNADCQDPTLLKDDPNPGTIWTGGSNGSGCEYKLDPSKCPGEAHIHYPWHSTGGADDDLNFDQGCYRTAAICGGHCGGHVMVMLNVIVTETWEGLMTMDNFKLPEILGREELTDGLNFDDNLKKVSQWKLYWQLKSASWFSPMPSSPFGLYSMIGNAVLEGTVHSNQELPDEWKAGIEQQKEDWAAFDGWWVQGSPYLKMDEDKLQTLKERYGTWEDSYSLGREMFGTEPWKVEFPLGFGKMLTEDDIYQILHDAGQGLVSVDNTPQRKVAEAAMRSCGQYWWGSSNLAKVNPLYNAEGAANEASFVLGILKREGIVSGINETTDIKSLNWGQIQKLDIGWGVVSTTGVQSGSVLGNLQTGEYAIVISRGHDDSYTYYENDKKKEKAGFWIVSCNQQTGGVGVEYIKFSTMGSKSRFTHQLSY